MTTRREFLGVLGTAGIAASCRSATSYTDAAQRHVDAAATPEEVAHNEHFWVEIARAFVCEPGTTNLNNAGVSPAPLPVQAAMQRELALSNRLPSHHLWSVQAPRLERVRERLARALGVDAEEVAITRNTSEGMQTCQLGLDLVAGDEVLCTELDYHRMLTTFRQRERRDGVRLVTLALPVPCDEPAAIVDLYRQHLTPRTKLIVVCHAISSTGQILPVADVVRLGRQRGIPVVVDGAHGFGQLVFDQDELGCDYYATSLHKWLCAPHGTGMLFVRREKIGGLWPLLAARGDQRDDIRKFEEIGTAPLANPLAIDAALDFQAGIGDARKFARLVRLRDYWAERLQRHDRVELLTSLAPGAAGATAAFRVRGIASHVLCSYLWRSHRIVTTAFRLGDGRTGVRVSPHVYTMLEDLDRFCAAIDDVVDHGLPG